MTATISYSHGQDHQGLTIGQFFCSLSDHIPRAANQMTVVQHHSEADTRIAGSWFRGTETTVDQKVAGERRPRKRWCA